MVNIISDKYDIYDHQGVIKILVRNDWFLSSNLQHLTNYYPEGTQFTNSDEPVFKVPDSLLTKAIGLLSFSSNQVYSLLSEINRQRSISDKR